MVDELVCSEERFLCYLRCLLFDFLLKVQIAILNWQHHLESLRINLIDWFAKFCLWQERGVIDCPKWWLLSLSILFQYKGLIWIGVCSSSSMCVWDFCVAACEYCANVLLGTWETFEFHYRDHNGTILTGVTLPIKQFFLPISFKFAAF